tara:strand:+ start:215 stop:475 length:261 start_codon:yes stop_codon:yes gene_type:complete
MKGSFHVIDDEVKDAITTAMDDARAALRKRLTVAISGLHVAKDRIEQVAVETPRGSHRDSLGQTVTTIDVAIADLRAMRLLYCGKE